AYPGGPWRSRRLPDALRGARALADRYNVRGELAAIERCADFAADALGGAAKRVHVQMRVARRGGRCGVAQQVADNREAEARTGPVARVRVPQVVNAKAVEPGAPRHRLPGPLKVGTGFLRIVARDDRWADW